MPELLIELYSEEVPASAQPKARKNFVALMKEMLLEKKIVKKADFDTKSVKIKCFTSPRRIVFVADGLPEEVKVEGKLIRGPRLDAPKEAIEGFLKSVGADSISKLNKQETEKGKYFVYKKDEEEVDTEDLLGEEIPKVLHKMANLWPKTMRWGDGSSDKKWIRPLRNILCLFDEEIVEFEFMGLESNDLSYGHKFLEDEEIEIENFEDYKEELEDSSVIFDHKKREDIIGEGLYKICKELNGDVFKEDLSLTNNKSVFNEAVGMTEYPVMLYGNIDKRFLKLPKKIIINTIRTHQKYFCIKDSAGKLLPYFAFVSNVPTEDNGQEIIKGNEKVLKARLNDAAFYVSEDLKQRLEDRADLLKKIVFHEKIGSVYDKVERIKVLSKVVAPYIGKFDKRILARSVELMKTDLATNAVSELPNLQGIIGGYYAKIQNEDKQVYKAVKNHYSPMGKSDRVPKTPLGMVLSLSDKVDTLCAMFIASEKPTGSRDPFALRRAALGIIRIVLEKKIDIPLGKMIDKSFGTFSSALYKKNQGSESSRQQKTRVREELIKFFVDRIRVFAKITLPQDIVNAVLDGLKDDDKKRFNILEIFNTIKQLDSYLEQQSSEHTMAIYKRIHNILNDLRKKGKAGILKKRFAKIKNLSAPEGRTLHDLVVAIEKKSKKFIKKKNYTAVLKMIETLRPSITMFFDRVVVDAMDDADRNNRILLLAKAERLFDEIADFSKIEIKESKE